MRRLRLLRRISGGSYGASELAIFAEGASSEVRNTTAAGVKGDIVTEFLLPTCARRIIKKMLPARILHACRMARDTKLFQYQREIRFLPQLLKHDQVSIDIGANIGLFTDILSRRSSKVLAFEPHPGCAEYLRKLNLRNCDILEMAASDRFGESALRVPLRSNQELHALSTIEESNDLVSQSGACGIVRHLVPTVTLDEILDQRLAVSDIVGFIKIDVEGHELAVLKGARSTIERHRPAMLIELEFRHGAPVEETFALLSWQTYRAFALVGSQSLSAITVGELRALQSDDRFQRKLKQHSYDGYVNNVIFLPEHFPLLNTMRSGLPD